MFCDSEKYMYGLKFNWSIIFILKNMCLLNKFSGVIRDKYL